MATRWGICSAGRICTDFCTSIKALPSDEHQIVAVAARDLDRAKAFADKFGIPKAYGSYEELAQDADVEIVYIGSIHPSHHDQTVLMLNHGKHVLVEKPMGMNVRQVENVMRIAREKKLFLMEGVWSRCFPAYVQLAKEISNSTIGEIRLVFASINFEISGVARLIKKEMGGGALLDLGIYPIQLALFVFQNSGQILEKVTANASIHEKEGTDTQGGIIMRFSGGSIASLNFGSLVKTENRAEIIGTKGKLVLEDPFWCPTELVTPTQTYNFPLPEGEAIFPNGLGLTYEIQNVRQCLTKGETECSAVPHSLSLQLASILQEVRQQIGVTYEWD